ncbi:hypothetical protein FXF05_06010 [Vibrio mimicus]|nr:hypothetical protein FXF05_06010 [Vibrio mimicus]
MRFLLSQLWCDVILARLVNPHFLMLISKKRDKPYWYGLIHQPVYPKVLMLIFLFREDDVFRFSFNALKIMIFICRVYQVDIKKLILVSSFY